jgi:hypothetical protein
MKSFTGISVWKEKKPSRDSMQLRKVWLQYREVRRNEKKERKYEPPPTPAGGGQM